MFQFNHIAPLLLPRTLCLGNEANVCIDNIATPNKANENSLIWIKANKADDLNWIEHTIARTIICSLGSVPNPSAYSDRFFITTPDPKLQFVVIANALMPRSHPVGIHPTAVIHPEAIIGDNVSIGAYSIIGKASIGANSVLYGNNYVYDNVCIGSQVIIHAGCVIGSPGFGYVREESGVLHQFPQRGSVIIEEDVEIGAGSTIDCAALDNTLIGRGSKIDNQVHIGHNVQIGSHCLIAANVVISGSVCIGERVWIGPNAVLSNAISIGDDTDISLGAVVIANVLPKQKVSGNFAQDHFAFMKKMIRS